jgi:hypothetical protein
MDAPKERHRRAFVAVRENCQRKYVLGEKVSNLAPLNYQKRS